MGEDSNIVPFWSPMVAPVLPYGTHLKSLKYINPVIASACQLHCQWHLMMMTSPPPPLSTAIANGLNIPYRYTGDAHTSLYKAQTRQTSSQGCTQQQQQHPRQYFICIGANTFNTLRLMNKIKQFLLFFINSYTSFLEQE